MGGLVARPAAAAGAREARHAALGVSIRQRSPPYASRDLDFPKPFSQRFIRFRSATARLLRPARAAENDARAMARGKRAKGARAFLSAWGGGGAGTLETTTRRTRLATSGPQRRPCPLPAPGAPPPPNPPTSHVARALALCLSSDAPGAGPAGCAGGRRRCGSRGRIDTILVCSEPASRTAEQSASSAEPLGALQSSRAPVGRACTSAEDDGVHDARRGQRRPGERDQVRRATPDARARGGGGALARRLAARTHARTHLCGH